MNKDAYESPDPEDLFNDTRMSFGGPIEGLRARMLCASPWGES